MALQTTIPALADAQPVDANRRARNRERFELELEFVQALANPLYIHELATTHHLSDPSFIRYLEYLHATWRQPKYARFLTYPSCLAHLELLVTSESFRKVMQDWRAVDAISEQEGWHWAAR